MKEKKMCLYSKQSQKLQISYDEYLALTEKVEEATRLQQLRNTVLADLQRVLVPDFTDPVAKTAPAVVPVDAPKVPPATEKKTEKVSVEFSAEAPKTKTPEQTGEPQAQKKVQPLEIPPIKKDITEHFNKADASGRLLNVFTQYYTFLNESCGGTVRVTIKDGFCSLWNYDEWEEFAFIDVFEGLLRIAVDPRYTDQLKSLNFCEVPRLLSNRRELVCLQIDDLNNLVLDVLTQAFSEVGANAR
jgi:hypothetical protein